MRMDVSSALNRLPRAQAPECPEQDADAPVLVLSTWQPKLLPALPPPSDLAAAAKTTATQIAESTQSKEQADPLTVYCRAKISHTL